MGRVARMGKMRNWSAKLKARGYLENVDVDGKVILEWI
jgi:hypothetical protein